MMRATHKCSECGGDVRVVVNRRRSPGARVRSGVTMKGHDLCRRCWKVIEGRMLPIPKEAMSS